MFRIQLFRAFRSRDHGDRGESDSVRRIASELDACTPAARARYLAAFAYVLSRVARADLSISAAETERMVAIMQAQGDLTREQATRVVEIAARQNRLFGGTEDFLVTREFRGISTSEQRCALLECLFVVAAVDGGISNAEEVQIRQIASELGFAHHHYIAIRIGFTHEQNVPRRIAT